MTKQDYELIAYAISSVEPVESEKKARAAWRETARSIASFLERENPRMKKELFLKACSFDYWVNRKPPRKA